MMQLIPYLRFDGTCREAMNFYKECLGGELTVQTIGESPMAADMPEAKDRILHSALIKGNDVLLMASDLFGPEGIIKGNTMTLSLNFDNEEETHSLFTKLSDGGVVTHPLKEEFWGGVYGDFTDRFGVSWMFNYQKSPNPAL